MPATDVSEDFDAEFVHGSLLIFLSFEACKTLGILEEESDLLLLFVRWAKHRAQKGVMRFAEAVSKSLATRRSIEWGSATTIIVGTLCVASKGDIIFQGSRANPVDFSTFGCARLVDSW